MYDRIRDSLLIVLMIVLICLAVAATVALLPGHPEPGVMGVHTTVTWHSPAGPVPVDAYATHFIGGRVWLQVLTPQGVWKLIDPLELRAPAAPTANVPTGPLPGPESWIPVPPPVR